MVEKKVGNDVKKKGLELKKLFDDLNAELELWKFSVENSKEGMRVELHAIALIKQTKNKK
jgi:hypothetical protein